MSSRLLTLCLLAYPRALRDSDGEVLLGMAEECARVNGVGREALGLLIGGLATRVSVFRGDLASVPWGEGLRLLVFPLAVANACLWSVAILNQVDILAVGPRSSLILAGALVPLLGAIGRFRPIAVPGAIFALAAALMYPASELYLGQSSSPLWIDVPGTVIGVDLVVAWVPVSALLLAGTLLERRPPRRLGELVRRFAIAAGALVLVAWYVGIPPQAPDFIPVAGRAGTQPVGALLGVMLVAPVLAMVVTAIRGSAASLTASALALAVWLPFAGWCSAGAYTGSEAVVLTLYLAWLVVGMAVLGAITRLASRRLQLHSGRKLD